MRYRPGLAARMTLAIALVSAAVAFFTYLANSRLMQGAVHDLEVQRAASARAAIESEVQDKVRRLTIAARLLGAHPGLIAAAVEDAPPAARRERLRPLLDRFFPVLDAGILEVVGRDERVLYRAHAPDAFGDIQQVWGAAEALTGREALVTAAGRSGIAIRLSVPLGEGGNPPAVLTAGIHLDDRLAGRIAAEIQAQVAILNPEGELLAASRRGQAIERVRDPELIAQSMREKHLAHALQRTATDETTVYFAQKIADQTYVWIVTVDSRKASAQVSEAEQGALLNALLFGLLSAALLGWLAHLHARRLVALQRETEHEVESLIRSSSSSSSSSSSEIDSLEQSVRLMRSRLMAHAAEMRGAMEAAEAGNRAKSEFLAVMSHELRTPLTSIKGALGLLAGPLAPELPERARSLSEVALAASERLGRLIDDILDMERIEHGTFTLRRERLDLAALSARAVDLNNAYAAARSVRLVCGTPAHGLPVEGDPDRLQQVFANLISNAIKHSPAGAAVEVTVTRAAQAARVAVRDRGEGVPETFVPRLFERFAQAAAPLGRGAEGTGLGLAISKAIVLAHGGAIGHEDAPGGGAIFWFAIPLAGSFDPLAGSFDPMPGQGIADAERIS